VGCSHYHAATTEPGDIYDITHNQADPADANAFCVDERTTGDQSGHLRYQVTALLVQLLGLGATITALARSGLIQCGDLGEIDLETTITSNWIPNGAAIMNVLTICGLLMHTADFVYDYNY